MAPSHISIMSLTNTTHYEVGRNLPNRTLKYGSWLFALSKTDSIVMR